MKRELVIMPDDITFGLIYTTHINHPTAPFQLVKVFDTRFFTFDKECGVNILLSVKLPDLGTEEKKYNKM